MSKAEAAVEELVGVEFYEDMLAAIRIGRAYQRRLAPPPPNPQCCQPPRTVT